VTPNEAVERLGGLPLKRYCEISGENANTIYQRIHKGLWLEGEQYVKPFGAGVWVLLDGVRAWALRKGRADPVPTSSF